MYLRRDNYIYATLPYTMKKYLIAIVLFLCVFMYIEHPTTFNTMYVLSGGTWQMKTAKGYTCERWEKTDKNNMHGFAFEVIGKDTVRLKNTKLIQNGDSIYYEVSVNGPSGGLPIRFKLQSSINNNFIFLNQLHTFPQQITYKLVSQDSAHFWLEGIYKGKYNRQDYYYTHVK